MWVFFFVFFVLGLGLGIRVLATISQKRISYFDLSLDRKVVATRKWALSPLIRPWPFQRCHPFVCRTFRCGDTSLSMGENVCISGTVSRRDSGTSPACSKWSNYVRPMVVASV